MPWPLFSLVAATRRQMAVDLKNFDPQRIAAQCPGLTIPPPQQPLGIGGQKAVWKCSYNGVDYALKVLVSEPATTERAREKWKSCVFAVARTSPELGL